MTRRNPILKWLDERPAWAVIAVSFVALLVLWHAIVVIGDYPTFILPGPLDVAGPRRVGGVGQQDPAAGMAEHARRLEAIKADFMSHRQELLMLRKPYRDT